MTAHEHPPVVWKSLHSTSGPSTGHALVVPSPDVVLTNRVMELVQAFYKEHPEIKSSHGIQHVLAVHDHAVQAIARHVPPLSAQVAMEIQVAALLHDVDDSKYFSNHTNYENARFILSKAEVDAHQASTSTSCSDRILEMIDWVSCSKNGNRVPESIIQNKEYYRLIPRWADRLEAVGKIGVVRCYQYNIEHDQPLSSAASPRAVTQEQVWEFATPDRLESYLVSGGKSDDMISHYYDKLLHIACPPKEIVRNSYLEGKAQESSRELIDMCIRFGKTGKVDHDFVKSLAGELGIAL